MKKKHPFKLPKESLNILKQYLNGILDKQIRHSGNYGKFGQYGTDVFTVETERSINKYKIRITVIPVRKIRS